MYSVWPGVRLYDPVSYLCGRGWSWVPCVSFREPNHTSSLETLCIQQLQVTYCSLRWFHHFVIQILVVLQYIEMALSWMSTDQDEKKHVEEENSAYWLVRTKNGNPSSSSAQKQSLWVFGFWDIFLWQVSSDSKCWLWFLPKMHSALTHSSSLWSAG